MKYTNPKHLTEGMYYLLYERFDVAEDNLRFVDSSTIDKVYLGKFETYQSTINPNDFHPKLRLTFKICRYETNNETSRLINDHAGKLTTKTVFVEHKMDYFELDDDEVLMYIVPESI